MSVTVTPTPTPPHGGPRRRAVESSSSWRLTDRLGLALAWTLGILFCLIAVAIVVYVFVQGIHYLRPKLLWTNPKVGFTEGATGGILDPIIGTFIVSGIALAIAGPVGVGVAVWLSEYGRPLPLARVVESTVEMFAGAPSIVLALFGLVIFDASFLGELSQKTGGVVFGKSLFNAGVILSFVALPYVVTTVREGLTAIPNHVREASYAVGKSKISTIRRIVLPAARSSTITGCMLGFGHAIGDTAIILLLAGDTPRFNGVGGIPIISALRGTGSTLTAYTYDSAPTGELNQTGKAFAAAFVLLIIVLILNVIVDVFARRARELRWN